MSATGKLAGRHKPPPWTSLAPAGPKKSALPSFHRPTPYANRPRSTPLARVSPSSTKLESTTSAAKFLVISRIEVVRRHDDATGCDAENQPVFRLLILEVLWRRRRRSKLQKLQTTVDSSLSRRAHVTRRRSGRNHEQSRALLCKSHQRRRQPADPAAGEAAVAPRGRRRRFEKPFVVTRRRHAASS